MSVYKCLKVHFYPDMFLVKFGEDFLHSNAENQEASALQLLHPAQIHQSEEEKDEFMKVIDCQHGGKSISFRVLPRTLLLSSPTNKDLNTGLFQILAQGDL